ncbi:TolC family protein [bacterium]|nr:TolC family protein [bacterium]
MRRTGWLFLMLLLAPATAAQPPLPNPFGPPETPLPPYTPIGQRNAYAALEPAAYPIDLPTALKLAGANNPTVGIARARAREAVARLDRAKLLWVPTLSAGPAFFYHEGIDQNRRADFFSASRGNFTVGAGPQWRFDLGDALYGPLVARRVVRAEEARSVAVGNAVQYEAASAYLDLLEAHGLLAVNARTLFRAEQMLTAAEAGAKAGVNKTVADVNRAATEVSLRRQEALVLRAKAGAASARLARLLLLDPAVELRPVEVAVVPLVLVPPENTMAQLVEVAVRSRPEMASALAELEAANAVVRQAKQAPLLPRVQADFIGGGMTSGRAYLNPAPAGTTYGWSPMLGQYNANAALVWQLDALGFGNAATVRQRQAVYDAAQYRVAEVRAAVGAEVAEAARTAAARFDALDAAQLAVREATEMGRKFRETAFGVGGPKKQFDALEPLTGIQALNQARTQYLQTVIEFNRAQFRLFTALGQPAAGGLDAAVSQPVTIPAVPPPPEHGAPLPAPR